MNKLLPFALALAFLLVGYNAYISSKPQDKAPIYKEIKKYSPYYFEKRLGGLEIKSKTDENFKEKPSNMEVFHRLEQLEREWGKKHLSLKNDSLIIYQDNKEPIKIEHLSKKSIEFIHKYYGI